MAARMAVSGLDARRLLRIVSDDRPDLPAEGLPLSLLCDLADVVRCDFLSFFTLDSARQAAEFMQDARRKTRKTMTGRSGHTTGTASRALTPTAAATCAA